MVMIGRICFIAVTLLLQAGNKIKHKLSISNQGLKPPYYAQFIHTPCE